MRGLILVALLTASVQAYAQNGDWGFGPAYPADAIGDTWIRVGMTQDSVRAVAPLSHMVLTDPGGTRDVFSLNNRDARGSRLVLKYVRGTMTVSYRNGHVQHVVTETRFNRAAMQKLGSTTQIDASVAAEIVRAQRKAVSTIRNRDGSTTYVHHESNGTTVRQTFGKTKGWTRVTFDAVVD
jgi:hypothetical protein